MSTTPRYFAEKHPAEVETRSIDWSAALPSGDAVVASAWAATPAGLTFTLGTFAPTLTTTRLSGGTAGVEYVITNTVTTQGGLTLVETVRQWITA